MPTAGSSFPPPKGLGLCHQSPPPQAALFRGISLSFIGFDAESLRIVAENASAALEGGSQAVLSNGAGASAAPLGGACAADVAAAEATLQIMQRKAEEVRLWWSDGWAEHLKIPLDAGELGRASKYDCLRSRQQREQVLRQVAATAATGSTGRSRNAFILNVCRMCLQAGARVLDASRESITAACFLVCNFAAAFTHLSRLSGSSAAGHLSGGQEDPQQLLAALEVEPLRLLTPFWLFACLRDGRVYAPDAHALFRVSTALTHTQPPLWQLQQPLQVYHHLPHSQRVLLLGFTRRLRRVRRPRSFACGVLSSDSDEGNKEGHRPEAAGRALAANDMEMAVACVEALGGSCLSVSSVLRAVEERSLGPPAATAEADAATDTWDRLGVDVVIVGHFSRLRKANTALLGKGPALHEAGTQQVRVNTQQRERRHGAKAELALLYKLQELGVPCVHHQWLIDAYCFGRAPPFDVYAIPTEPAPQIEVPAAPSAAARRQQVLQGVQVLVADSEVTRDPSLLRRIGELGCTDVTAIPSLLGICPWLFSCGATRELAAVLCGCGDRVQCVSAALERAEEARKRSWENFAAVLFVIKREDLAGLLDLAAVAAEAVEATASSQRLLEGAPTGRAASTRSAQRQQAAPLQHDPQQQKIRNLISAAQQQVLQQLPTAMASQAQRFWEEATNVAVRPVAADAAAFVAKRDIPALAARGPLAVSPEWIASCWAEARRVPVDSAHGRIEAPEFWADALASDSAGHMEDAALLAALQDCGGTVIYGDFPVVTDVKEARLRRAVGALEHALTISWDIQQDRFLEQSH